MRLIIYLLILVSIALFPLALFAQQKFVYSDEPFLTESYKSIKALNILTKYFNLTRDSYIYVIVKGDYNTSYAYLKKILNYTEVKLYSPQDVISLTYKNYNSTIYPILKKYENLSELYYKLKELKNSTLLNFPVFLYILNITYGVPLGVVNPYSNNYTEIFYKIYTNYLNNYSRIDAARLASLTLFKNPFILYFDFKNYSNVSLVYNFILNFRNYSDLIYKLTGVYVEEEILKDPYGYVLKEFPPPPISLENFRYQDYWLFLLKVPSNYSLEKVSELANNINGYVTGPLAIYSDSEKTTSENLKFVDIVTIVLIIILLIFLLRSLFPIIILIISALFGLELAYSLIYLSSIIGYQPYYISGLVIPPIVFGISVDYSILFLYRYFEELGNKRGKEEALFIAFRRTGRAIFYSGLSITVGFLAFIISNSSLLSNIGTALLISSISSLISSIIVPYSLLKIIPLNILKFPRRELPSPVDIRQKYLIYISNFSIKHNIKIIIFTLIILIISLFIFLNGSTNASISEILNYDSKSLKGLDLLSKMYNYSVEYVVIEGNPNDSYNKIINVTKLLINEGILVYGPYSIGKVIIENKTFLTNYYYSNGYTLLTIYIPYPVFSDQAVQIVEKLFKMGFLVAGNNAERYDIISSTTQTYYNIVLPLTILFIFVYLFLILGSVTIPLRLSFTILFSSLVSIGIMYLVFGSVYWLSPLVVFSLMFSLGIDYDLFIILRIIEEKGNENERILNAISKTGLVVTAAGIILAGAFFSLTVAEMRFLKEIGFVVGLSVILDTFIVRPVLVPAILSFLGKYNWWPRFRVFKMS